MKRKCLENTIKALSKNFKTNIPTHFLETLKTFFGKLNDESKNELYRLSSGVIENTLLFDNVSKEDNETKAIKIDEVISLAETLNSEAKIKAVSSIIKLIRTFEIPENQQRNAFILRMITEASTNKEI